jgi:hypothetical protein
MIQRSAISSFTNYFQASRSGAYEEEIKPSKIKEVVLSHDNSKLIEPLRSARIYCIELATDPPVS